MRVEALRVQGTWTWISCLSNKITAEFERCYPAIQGLVPWMIKIFASSLYLLLMFTHLSQKIYIHIISNFYLKWDDSEWNLWTNKGLHVCLHKIYRMHKMKLLIIKEQIMNFIIQIKYPGNWKYSKCEIEHFSLGKAKMLHQRCILNVLVFLCEKICLSCKNA